MRSNIPIEAAVANLSGAMGADTISKNGRSSKSLTSRGNNIINILNRKFILVLFVAVLTTAYTQAQFNFGTRIGFYIPFNDISFYNLTYGFQIGVVGDYTLNDNLSIQPGVLFSKHGYWKHENDFLLGDKISASLNLNYIHIPVNIHYKLLDFDFLGTDSKLLLQVGPYFSHAVSGKLKMKVNGKKETEKIELGKDGYMKTSDFGLGVGVVLHASTNRQACLGYNIGLTNLNPDNDSNIKMRNHGLSFTLTFLFGK